VWCSPAERRPRPPRADELSSRQQTRFPDCLFLHAADPHAPGRGHSIFLSSTRAGSHSPTAAFLSGGCRPDRAPLDGIAARGSQGPAGISDSLGLNNHEREIIDTRRCADLRVRGSNRSRRIVTATARDRSVEASAKRSSRQLLGPSRRPACWQSVLSAADLTP
jgi:hypothetical protein